MIIFNTERGLVRVESWDQVHELPGFSESVDPKAVRLKSIIASYKFKEFRPCGLASCRTKHGRGYVVATDHGTITNIGKDCGKREFSIDFEVMRRKFDRDLEVLANQEAVRRLQAQAPIMVERLHGLRKGNRGADWLNRQIRWLRFDSPLPVATEIKRISRTRDPVIRVSVPATEEEIQAIEASSNSRLRRPYLVSKQIGQLEGGVVLYGENDLHDRIIMQLEEPLKQIIGEDLKAMKPMELKRLAKFGAGIEQKMEDIERIIQQGRRLFSTANFGILLAFLKEVDMKSHREFRETAGIWSN